MTRWACRAVVRPRAAPSNLSASFCAFFRSVSFVLRCARVPSAFVKQANQNFESRFLRTEAIYLYTGSACLFGSAAGNHTGNNLRCSGVFKEVRLPMNGQPAQEQNKNRGSTPLASNLRSLRSGERRLSRRSLAKADFFYVAIDTRQATTWQANPQNLGLSRRSLGEGGPFSKNPFFSVRVQFSCTGEK
jgi:hypothetical protein